MSMWVHWFQHLCAYGRHHACPARAKDEAIAAFLLSPYRVRPRDLVVTPVEEEE